MLPNLRKKAEKNKRSKLDSMKGEFEEETQKLIQDMRKALE